MDPVTLYHNPACGTSRNTLGLIRNAGIEPHIVEYLRTPPDRASSAMRCPCTVPRNTVSSRIATPRFTGGEPMTMTSGGMAGV